MAWALAGRISSAQMPRASSATAGHRPSASGYARPRSSLSAPTRRAAHSSAPYVLRNGLSEGHGLPISAAMIGSPTQMPIHRSTPGSGEMSPTTNPTTMAPYHHPSPTTRRMTRAGPAIDSEIGRSAYGASLGRRAMTTVATNDAPTAIAAPAR